MRRKSVISKRAENCCVGKLESMESHGWRRDIESVALFIPGRGNVQPPQPCFRPRNPPSPLPERGFDRFRYRAKPTPDNVYWLRPLLVTYQLQLIQHRRRVRVIASSKRNDEIASPRSDRIIPRSNRNIVRRISKLFHSSTNESFCKKSSLVKYT